MVGNLRAAGLTGPAYEDSIVIAQQDVRALTPDYLERMAPAIRDMKPGVFCFNPPHGVRIGAEHGEDALLALYAGMGRAFGALQRLARRLFRGQPRFRGGLRPPAGHDEAVKQRQPPRRLARVPAVKGNRNRKA